MQRAFQKGQSIEFEEVVDYPRITGKHEMFKQTILTLLTCAASLALGGCSNLEKLSSAESASPKSSTLTAAPEITSEEQGDGLHDLVFFIEKKQLSKNGAQVLSVIGLNQGKPIKFSVELSKDWRITNDKLVPSQGFVRYARTGTESDEFVVALDKIYGTKITPSKMQEEVTFSAVTLEGDPSDLSKGPVKMKLFFESKNPDDAAEVYTNIDVKTNRLTIPEKDADYRANLVKALKRN